MGSHTSFALVVRALLQMEGSEHSQIWWNKNSRDDTSSSHGSRVAEKKRFAKKVTWNKNLTDVKLITPQEEKERFTFPRVPTIIETDTESPSMEATLVANSSTNVNNTRMRQYHISPVQTDTTEARLGQYQCYPADNRRPSSYIVQLYTQQRTERIQPSCSG